MLFEKKKQNEHVDSDELLEVMNSTILYLNVVLQDSLFLCGRARSSNVVLPLKIAMCRYISPILQLSESDQSALMKIFEELSEGADKHESSMLKELQSLEDENSQMKEQLESLKRDYEIARQQLVFFKSISMRFRSRKPRIITVDYWKKDLEMMS